MVIGWRSRQFIRTVTEVRPEWLMEYAPDYFDPSTFPENSETRRALQRVLNKASGSRRSRSEWAPSCGANR
jgi:hypothetical protein